MKTTNDEIERAKKNARRFAELKKRIETELAATPRLEPGRSKTPRAVRGATWMRG